MEIEYTDLLGLASDIIDEFEGLLADYNIKLPNKAKEEHDGDPAEVANLFGSDYYSVESGVIDALKKHLELKVLNDPYEDRESE